MPQMQWTDELSVNIQTIDDQHKKLIGLINNLYTAMKVGQGKSVLDQVLTEMTDYAAYHFKTEKDLFERYQYPETMQHLQEHNEYAKTINGLKEKHEKGQLTASIETMLFLREWLSKHILETDKKYVPFLKDKGVI
jgi:hemerythrin-like metal-binding protein